MQALIFIEASGKAQAWARITRKLGMTATVIATSGHVCGFPSKLFPIGIDLGEWRRMEVLRRPDPGRKKRILDAVGAAPRNAAIVIATDDDIEGDVIAYDVADLIFRAYPERQGSIVRVRPGPITQRGIRASLASAQPLRRVLNTMTADAIPGRARAITDRWIGATFSRMAGVPVGRVRSAILGATFYLHRAPEKLRKRPETGEITLQARSAMGGRPFVAKIPLTGAEPPERIARLKRLATKWAMRIVPGTVRPLASLSAAVAPRVGTVRPFNTVDALVHAARHHKIPVPLAMGGLQDAYLQGMISYPRTDSRNMSNESASRVTMLGFGCGLEGLQAEVLSSETMLRGGQVRDGAHEGLHPVLGLTTQNTDQLREMVRRPIRIPPGGWDRVTAMQAMTVLVSRRAFEASREIYLERGNWSPDNGPGDLDHEDIELLRDLDWFRDKNFTFPWTRNYATGVHEWPMDAVLLELMADEGIGRPSTYANHVATAMTSGDIQPGEFPNPPRPSPRGMQTLRKTPGSVWSPAVCRLIEAALENRGNKVGEDENASLTSRARHRVLFWLQRVPEDFRGPLLAALKTAQGGRGIGDLLKTGPSAPAEEASPLEVSMDMTGPTPFH